MQAEIREHLIGNLETIFGRARNADGLAEELARHIPVGATADALAGLARRIVETRRAKGFPPAAELIAAIRALPVGSVTTGRRMTGADRLNEWYDRERAAVRLLWRSAVARRAVDERWAPALIDFVIEHGREPDAAEMSRLIAASRRSDIDAAEVVGPMRDILVGLRNVMHAAASRRVGFPINGNAESVAA